MRLQDGVILLAAAGGVSAGLRVAPILAVSIGNLHILA
jgi:hypothetical protein